MSRIDDLDNRPHSKACGWKSHPHGPDCAKDCPTCYEAQHHTPFLQVLLDKGLKDGLRILSVVSEEDLVAYFSNPYLSREPFNVQEFTISVNGRGHDFIRGLCMGMVAGILTDPEIMCRDIRGCLAILANDGVDILTGNPIPALMVKPEDESE